MTGVTNDSPAGAIKNALSGFSNSLIWLIGIAIVISRGLAKTGLGNRIGYYFISLFGRKTIGIGYALAISELYKPHHLGDVYHCNRSKPLNRKADCRCHRR